MNPQPADLESAALPIELHPFDRDQTGLFLSRLFMQRVSTKPWTVLHQLQTLGSTSLLDYTVIPLTGLRALKPHILTHDKPQPKKAKLPAEHRQQAAKIRLTETTSGSL